MAFNYWQKFDEGLVYHIYNRSISNLVLYREEVDYEDFLFKYAKYFSNYFDTIAYCLIPNHFHFIVRIKKVSDIQISLKNEKTKAAQKLLNNDIELNTFLEDQMKRFFSSVALTYKNKYGHRGAVFEERMKRVAAKSESKIMYLLCYIHHNPIHHFLVKKYEEWKNSSYNYYKSEGESIIIRDEILNWIGGIDVFDQMHKDFKFIPGHENLE